MQMTPEQEKRTVKMMSEYAGESVTISATPTTIYAHGSELACLRIFARYQTNGAHHNPNARVGFSNATNGWYFSLDMPAHANGN